MGQFYSTKTYGHERGLSCAFRQWRANSHCNLLHGYALSFTFIFAAEHLDERNWVQDFGGLKELKDQLDYWFDHTTAVAEDDPTLKVFEDLASQKIIDLRVLKSVGCEAFAAHAFKLAKDFIDTRYYDDSLLRGLRVVSCEVKEHSGNSAIYAEEVSSEPKR